MSRQEIRSVDIDSFTGASAAFPASHRLLTNPTSPKHSHVSHSIRNFTNNYRSLFAAPMQFPMPVWRSFFRFEVG